MAKMSDICDDSFFVAMAGAVSGTAGEYIDNNRSALVMHVLVNYQDLNALSVWDNIQSSQAGLYVGRRFALSLQKIFDAVNKQYDPLANTDVVETEEKDGKDINSRGGTDTSTLVSSNSIHSATTFDNPNVENETGKTISSGSSTMGYNSTNTLTYDTTITRRKSGNIGVMPTQQLLDLEYELRIKRTFFEAISTCCAIAISSGVWSDE